MHCMFHMFAVLRLITECMNVFVFLYTCDYANRNIQTKFPTANLISIILYLICLHTRPIISIVIIIHTHPVLIHNKILNVLLLLTIYGESNEHIAIFWYHQVINERDTQGLYDIVSRGNRRYFKFSSGTNVNRRDTQLSLALTLLVKITGIHKHMLN